MIQWRDLSKRERKLVQVLIAMVVLMFLSRNPETVGIDLAIALAWIAFSLFFVMLGIVIFVKDDTYEQLNVKAANQALERATTRARTRAPRPPHREGYGDGLD
ncbi:MAG TPA: hypothetical protein VFS42_04930 [Burkholderiaceae bacterium]|nr:hypothetical protein [Burkholderiaceae bacterium]